MEDNKDIVEETLAFDAAEDIAEVEENESVMEVVEADSAMEIIELDENMEQAIEVVSDVQVDVTPDVIEKAVVGSSGAVTSLSQEEALAQEEFIKDDLPPELRNTGSRMDTEARWYVLHTFNGYETVAEDNLKKVIEKYDLQERVFEIFIPTEDTVVEKKEKKVLVPMKTMPSYIFVKMIYGDDIWHTITRTRGITGFVGPKGRPLPLSAKEVIAMKLERKVNQNVKLSVGDAIQIVDGPLAGQTAVVTAVDISTSKCVATVNMFGRPTSVDLYISQIKKI